MKDKRKWLFRVLVRSGWLDRFFLTGVQEGDEGDEESCEAELHVGDDARRNACLFDSRRFNGLTFPAVALYKRKRPASRGHAHARTRPPISLPCISLSTRDRCTNVVGSVFQRFHRSATLISAVKRVLVLPLYVQTIHARTRLVKRVHHRINLLHSVVFREIPASDIKATIPLKE